MQWQFDDYLVSTDRALLDFEVIYRFISNSYWAKGIPRDTLQNALSHSICFGLYHSDCQVGFARVVSDCATFAYLADVFVIESERGKGLSKKLIECVLAYEDLKGLRRFMLATKDAHSLYAKYGFEAVAEPQKLMQIHRPDIYR